MEPLKIDKTKLKTIANYAKDEGVKRQTIYARIKSGALKSIVIDGVMFIKLE